MRHKVIPLVVSLGLVFTLLVLTTPARTTTETYLEGILNSFTTSRSSDHDVERWEVEMKIDDRDYSAHANSRLVLVVLETAVLRLPLTVQWPVQVEIADDGGVKTVRVNDKRETVCEDVLQEKPTGFAVEPLSPTAFAYEDPPKWAFFFRKEAKCREFKGTSLDVYTIIESAWKDEELVRLEFDGDLIVKALRESG